MRMLLTAMNCPKGDLVSNLAGHRDLLADGRSAGCRLVLLPEMSLTGYQPSAAIGLEHPAVQELVAATGAGPALGLGMVEQPADGGKPYITHVVAAAGRIITVHRKAGLGEDEHADFRPGEPSGLICVVGLATSIAVCAEIGTAPPYELRSHLVLGPAAPGLYGPRRVTDQDWQRGFDWWRETTLASADRFLRPGQWLAVSTQAGATDDEDFPGWAALIGSGGRIVAELADWREDSLVVDLPE